MSSQSAPLYPHGDPTDQDIHKGAVEGDRPGDPQKGNQNAPGVDKNGWPDDPIATAEDAVGANEDETQG
jgi:hypothetical protein